MSGLITDIAQAVAAELNSAPAGTFAMPFTAQRHYRPQYDLAELKTLRVSVVPKGISIASAGRSLNQHDVSVDIAVQQKVDPSKLAELDGLMGLVEQVAEFFRLRRLSAFPAAVWVKTENLPVYAPEHLEQHRVFTSVLTVTWRVVK